LAPVLEPDRLLVSAVWSVELQWLDVVLALQFGLFRTRYRDVATFCGTTEAIAVALCADASQALEIF